MILNFDHMAILTSDLEAVASRLPTWLTLHDPEKHAAEGTLERYVCPESDSDPSLLLIQAIQDGPYSTALKKRGPGLHHIACSTDSIDGAIQHFASHGMLLHPISLKTYARQEAWMCRPGIPFLLELSETPSIAQVTQQPTLLQLPGSRTGDHDPIHFVPNAVITTGPCDTIELQIGDNTCNIDPVA